MDGTALMRLFSIRLRMIGAIGVVFALLMLLGAAGWWGIQSLIGVQNELLQLECILYLPK